MMIWIPAALHVLAFILMLLDVEPFHSFFYSFAWWSYIFLIAGLNHRSHGNSLIYDRPREFVWIFFLSTPVWLLFEAYNFQLNNWYYLGVPVRTFIRWPGYLIAFGTVLPGLFETATFLENRGLFAKSGGRPIRVRRSLLIRFVLLGLLMSIAPLLSPSYFFPLAWLGLIFLLDPLIYISGYRAESFLGQLAEGRYGLVLRLLLTGLICGLLWEFWNYWAGSKWVYSIPRFDFVKIFEMPLLGYLGFAPFALECYLIYQVSRLFRDRFWPARSIQLFTVTLLALYCILIFRGIDRFTVATYRMLW